MERDPIKNDARRQHREDRLGGKGQTCLLCPEHRPAALIPATRKFLQMHHVAGRANDPRLVVPLCLNCHADLTEKYRVAGVPMAPAGNLLDRLVGWLRGVGRFLPDLGQACGRLADDVTRFTMWLDTQLPGWRDAPEAR